MRRRFYAGTWLFAVAALAASAKTEYSAADFYSHGTGAVRYARVVGIEPGRYILAVDRPAPTDGDEPRNANCFLNGLRLPVSRCCPPGEKTNEPGGMWVEFEEADFRDGDILAFSGEANFPFKMRLLKEPLPHDVFRLFDESAGKALIADLTGCVLTPTSLTVSVEGRMGRAIDDCLLDVHVYDFWQNDLVKERFRPVVDGVWKKTWAFGENASGETRAVVRYSRPDGRYVRRFLNARSDVRTGFRRRMVLGGFARSDEKKGGRNVLSTLSKAVAVPAWLREGRTLLFAERIYRTGRVFVNGREVGSQTRANLALPCEYDITDAIGEDGGADIRFEVEMLEGESPLTDVELRCAPAVRLPLRPVVTTKMEGRSLHVSTPSVPEGCTVAHRVLRRGREAVREFRDGATVLWPDVEPWGPVEFPLYELETTLFRDGAAIDRLSTRFGFREFSARGMDYLWNGRPYRGISRTGGMSIPRYGRADRSRATMEKMLEGLETSTHDDARFIRHVDFVETFYDWCDEIGVLASFCSPLSKGGQMSTALDGDDEMWKDTLAVNGRMVDVYRHHPSINVWELSCEFWVHSDDRAYQKMLPSFALLHEKDPSRDAGAGSDMDFRGMNRHIDTHYPAAWQFLHEDTFLPDSLLWRPVDRPFTNGCMVPFGQQKRVGNSLLESPLLWGVKPITCQETGWSVNIKRPHGSTQLFRDTSYGGFNTMEGHHSTLNYLTFLGQRDAGVTLIGPWRAAGLDNQSRTAPWIDVWAIERYHAFYEGTAVSYQVDLFHDVLRDEAMDFFWRLERADGGEVVAEGRRPHHFDFCEYRRDSISFTAPKPGRYRVVYGLGDRVKGFPVEVYAKCGDEKGLLKGEFVVGPGDPVDGRLAERIRRGARVLLLPRSDYPAVFPVTLRKGGHDASVNWTFRPDDPVLAGLAEEDLSYWYPGHATGRGYFDKPVSGCTKTIIEAGGPNGLVYAALLEIPMGKGAIYATRLDLDPEKNPIAAKLLRNIRSRLGPGPRDGGRPSRLGVAGERHLRTLKGWGVDCELWDAKSPTDRFAALFVDGRDAKAAAAAVKAGLPVIVQNPDPAIWNVTIRPNGYKARQGAALRLVEGHPLLAGLTNFDFFWRKIGVGFAGENPGATKDPSLMADPVGEGEIFGADDELLFPRFLAQRGNVYFSTLNMHAATRIAAPLCERIWTTMLANLGVKVTPGMRVERPSRLREKPLEMDGPKLLSSRYAEGAREVVLDAKGRKCGWFTLRHVAKWTIEPLPVFSAEITYEDGVRGSVEFAGGVNVRDLDDPDDEPFAIERFTATQSAGQERDTPLGMGFVYETAWPNERPDVGIASVRIRPLGHGAAAIMGFSLAEQEQSEAPADARKCDKALCDRIAAEGSRLQAAKKYGEAIGKYELAHAADPRQLYVMNAIGNCYQESGDTKSAEKWYLKSLRADINQPPVWDWLKAIGSTATLDEGALRRVAQGAPTLVVAGLAFSTDGGKTWTEDPPILSDGNRRFRVRAEWAGGDSRDCDPMLMSVLESADGRDRHEHVNIGKHHYYAYYYLHQTPRPYEFDLDFSGLDPRTYKMRFRVWYRLKSPDPSLPGPDKRKVEATRSFSVEVRASASERTDDAHAARLYAERLAADTLRPKYHFTIDGYGFAGDPNGAFWHKGRYHLMYLYQRRPDGYCWGHASSIDLLHWRRHPDAIGIGPNDEGCGSGGAFVDDDGTAYLSYWMLWGPRGLGLARSKDPAFDAWEKFPGNPVVKSTHWGWTLEKDRQGNVVRYGSADPSNIWKKDGRYYMLAGNLCLLDENGRRPGAPEDMKGDCAYLFESEDLKTWKYRHPFYRRRKELTSSDGWTDASEDNMCPCFLPLPLADGRPSGKHLLLFISHNRGCQYYIGRYDTSADKFLPERHGRMTWADPSYFAPEALVDGKGRQIAWSWLRDNDADDYARFGWSGVYGLPRSLWLAEDGSLGQAPVEEVKGLRINGNRRSGVRIAAGEAVALDGFPGGCCEVELEMDASSAERFALAVQVAEGAAGTVITYDAAAGELVFDASKGMRCAMKPVERAPFRLSAGEALRLRVFVDGAVVEVHANDRQSICRRAYPPSGAGQMGVTLSARGGDVLCRRLDTWEMAEANPF